MGRGRGRGRRRRLRARAAPTLELDAADFEIARRVKLEPHPALVRVVTSDRWLADRVQATGVAVHGAATFRSMIDGG
jgi:hypothetical protein